MRKLVPSRSWRFIIGISVVLIGLGGLAFSQLAEDSAEEPPPSLPGGALPPLPGEAADASVEEGSPSARIKKLRDDLAIARRALARAKQVRSESDRRSKAELDRMRKDLELSKEELRLAQRVFSENDPSRATKLSGLQDQVDKALAKLKVREQGLAREQAYATRKLQSLEEELEASEGILADSLAEGISPDEALPAVSLLQENLKHTHNDIASSLNDSARNEQDVLAVAQGLGSTVDAAQQELAVAREIARRDGRSKELETAEHRGSSDSGLKPVTDFQLEESPRLRPEIGELDITSRTPSVETIRQLQEKVDASHGLQASLNEDVEKLRTELKQAFRKIISMQMKLEESDKLVSDLERQKDSLIQSKNEGITGVDGMNRMMARLEKELASAQTELSQARDSLNAEKIKSAAVITNQTAELQRTKTELDRVKALANAEGRDAVSMLELEEELNRTKTQLLTLHRQNLESGAGTADIKAELKNAFGEIMKLRAELSGKDDLEQQLASLEKTLAATDGTIANPEHVNELIRNLNAAKLALQKAQAEQEKERNSLSLKVAGLEDELQQSVDNLDLAQADITRKELEFSGLVKRLGNIQQAQDEQENMRRFLSEQVAGLEDELQQSRDNLDLSQVDMARKELEFSDLVKGLESELSGTQRILRQATNAHTQGSDVIEIMDADLGAAQTRMQQITDEMEKERLDAAKHIRDLQLELQTFRLRQESILDEVREKDDYIATRDGELKRALASNAKVEEQLKEVEAMSRTLSELNAVLRSTESVQHVNADQANALVGQLRDELEQAKVEALLATQSKGDVERRTAARMNALENQLNDTQNQLELTKGQFHEVTGEGAELIAELRGNLNQAQAEIALLKQAGAGESIGTEKLAAQLQEALGAIQVLQHNLTESEKVNAEVDDLRLRLAAAMEANISEKELEEAEAVSLRKKMRTLEMELAMAQQTQSGVRVTAQQLFSKLKDQLEASRDKVASMQARLGQSEDSSVGTIADLEEQLARSIAEKQDIEQRMHKLLQGKTESVAALEHQLVLTKTKIDELEQLTQGTEPTRTRITTLEQQLVTTKAQLDALNEQRQADGVGSIRAKELEQQLVDTQNRLNELLAAAQQGTPGQPPSPSVVAQLEAQLNDARSALNLLHGTLAQRDKENTEIEAQLEKALENMMDMQMSGDGGGLRHELDALKRQLAEAKAVGPSPAPADSTATIALQLEIAKLKSDLEQARQNQAVDQTADLATLQLEIDQLKKDLQQAAQGNATLPGTVEARLKGELEAATEIIVDLQNQLAASKKQFQDMSDLETARASGDDATMVVLSKKLEEAANAIRVLKDDMAKSEAMIAKREEDASKLDDELEESFQAMQKLKNERDDLAEVKKTLGEQVIGLEDLNAKLTAANNASQQASETDVRLKRERDDLLRSNLVLRTDLDKYKNEIRRLQESLAVPRPSVGNAANMQAQITSLESQVQVAKTAEGTARGDFDRVSDQLKDAMRQVMVLETNLGQAEGRLKQLEKAAAASIASSAETLPKGPSPESLATRALRDEVLRLRAELEAAQAAGSSRSQTEDRLRDTSRKLLAAQMELERSNQQLAVLDVQANKVEARRRSDVEREKAANQMVSLLNEKLKREEAKNLALQEGIRKARVVISSLRGEPGASPSGSTISSRRRPSMFEVSPRTAGFTPRSTSTTPPPRFFTPTSPPTFSGVQPRPLPSRTDGDGLRFRPSRSPSVPEGFTRRSSSPVGRIVDRGTAKVDFEVVVQFLDKTIKPASNVEFFLTQEAGLEDITAGAGIRLPDGVNSAAELWARSIHRGYSYPGMAAKIRDSLSQAAVARFKTNSSGAARLTNLPVGRYIVIGTAPMGAIGVVWSQPVDVSDGTKVRLDLRNVAFAK